MAGPNKEIGIFDAIYSLMEHEHRLQGAELSGQRVRALQAGNVDLFNQTTSRIADTDATLLFILQKREAQATEFEKNNIEQPGLSMAEKLHEYMLTLSKGTLPRIPTASLEERATESGLPTVVPSPKPRIEASTNGRVVSEPPLATPRAEPALPSTPFLGLPPELEEAIVSRHEPEFEPAPLEPVDPLAEYKALVSEEPKWDIPSRPLTQKLESGRCPFGIRPARVTLASVKYGAGLKRLNSRRPRAVQEAYAEGSGYAPVPTATADKAVDSFVNDYMVRKGKRWKDLPQEVQDTVQRIKQDPLLGPLTRSAKDRNRLVAYAQYKQSLEQILLEGSPTPDVIEESKSSAPARAPRQERAREAKMPELAPQQLRTVESYLRICIDRGWPSDMRRAVALEQYRDQIPSAGSISDIAREKVITNKMGAVARERVRVEKKLIEAVDLMEKGIKPSVTMQTVEREAAKMLGVEKVTLSEVLDLINKRVTPDQLRQKASIQSAAEDRRQPIGTENVTVGKPVEVVTSTGSDKEVARGIEDLQADEELAFYALLGLGEKGLVFETIEEACAIVYKEELEAITDPQDRMTRFELLRKGFSVAFNRSINRIEGARSRGARESQPYLALALDWLNDQEIDGQKIYASREGATLRRIGAREVDLSQYLRKSRSPGFDRNQRGSYSGSRW